MHPILLLIYIILSYPVIVNAGETMSSLFKLDKSNFLIHTHKYHLNNTVSVLFEVPKCKSVGTNTIDNEITLITFDKDHLNFESKFKDAFLQIGGGSLTFLPMISKEIIGYAQTRRFLMFNIPKETYERYRICMPLEEDIIGAAIADAKYLLFIFNICIYDEDASSANDYRKVLRLIDLSAKKQSEKYDAYQPYDDRVKVVNEINIDKENLWSVSANTLFIFNDHKIICYKVDFSPSYHPLEEIFKKYVTDGSIHLTQLNAHPEYPFAVLSASNQGPKLAVWRNINKPELLTLYDGIIYDFSFSHDGKWAFFQRYIRYDQSECYIVPISTDYPYYLGSPIYIGDFNTYEKGVVWIENPINLVISTKDNLLLRWELTNEAHPESDMSSFWEYIISRDIHTQKK